MKSNCSVKQKISLLPLSFIVYRLSLILAASIAATALPQDQPAARVTPLFGIGGGERMQIYESFVRIDPPRLSPKHKWAFEWAASGFGRLTKEDTQFELKVRVFAQQRRETNDPGGMVARMAMRLWDYNAKRLGLDHKAMYDNGRVHFYLAFGGPAGGEQLFDEDEEGGIAKRVNTIYIYQVQNVKDPVELAREIAHEYGHATLPPVGGFKEPEDWANGYLGEKLYLRYLRNEILAKRLDPADAMGATGEQLDKFVKREIDPLAHAVWLNGPDFAKLSGSGPAAMNAYVGLALYAEQLLAPKAFARSLQITGSTQARDFAPAIILAAAEPQTYVIDVPAALKGKDIWIPLGKGKLNGIKPLRTNGDWALIRPLAGIVRVTNGAPTSF
jgi:hypothetical protein